MSEVPLVGGNRKQNDVPSISSTMMVQITTDKSGPKLVCPVCDKALVSLNGYVKHMKKHEPPGGYLCNYCDDRFCLEDHLKKHKDEKHKILACQICHETFDSPQDYRNHIQDIHKGVDRRMIKCEKCGMEFKTAQAAKRHNETQCGQIKPHPCDQCKMAFYTKYNLAEHKKIHSGEKKFCCSYCGKSFMSNGRLVIHERSHTGEKPYKCDVCGKCFAHRESIVTHSSIHTGVKLVVCKCCGSRFSCHSNLIKHRRTRPDTCGLPIYNSTKETKRNGNSRIPPCLMSSEIKIVRASKVIKPKDEQQKKTKPVNSNEGQKKPKASKHKGRSKKVVKSGSEDDDTGEDDSDDNEIIVARPRRSLRSNEPPPVEEIDTKPPESSSKDFDSDNYSDDPLFDSPMHSVDDSSDSDKPKVKPEPLDKNPVEIVDRSCSPVKSEEDQKTEDFFDQKEEILDKFLAESTVDVKYEPLVEIKEESEDVKKDEIPPPAAGQVVVVNETDKQNENEKKSPSKRTRRTKSSIVPSEASVEEKKNDDEDESEQPKKRRQRSALRKKLRFFKKERVYECKFCAKVYHIKKPYEKHLRTLHKQTDADLRDLFKDEDNDIPDEYVHRCPICSKIYLMAKRLTTHITFHGPDGSLIHKCPGYCNLYFRTKEEALEHARGAHKECFYCNICDKYSQSPDALKIHKRTHFEQRRQASRNLICDKCGKSFASRTSLNDHSRSNCGKDPLYRCDICDKRFSTAGILKTHSLLHKDEQPYACDKCGKRFKIKAQYKTHIKMKHTDNKPFKCDLCPKAYPYRESLLTHMTVHTGLKRYSCNGCSKRFTCISNLQAHRKVYADTCGLQPLNSKPSTYLGVQKGQLLMGTKPSY
ncbi:zinc finger protein 665 [Eupeodes corollae]|uniref:zinc finger protein 665 n=1 Tax=Eupeodes corollae TaxID=290404 RepID=UPI002493074C|nr:zinc finger protein 665 [Eupeodes corollae]